MRMPGWPEIVVILLVLLVIFGATRLPKMGASLGQSLRAFKGAITGQDKPEDEPEEPSTNRVKSGVNEEERS